MRHQGPTNMLDFAIVISSILELILYSQPWIKVFRALRALRPLRLLSHSKGMMKVFSSVFKSMFAMGAVSFVWVLVGSHVRGGVNHRQTCSISVDAQK